MREKRLLIFYPDAGFVQRFSAYLEKRTSLPLRCRSFTEADLFYEAARKNGADLLLLPKSEAQHLPPDLPAPCLFFSESSEEQAENELPLYRSMDKQVRRISRVLDFSGEEAENRGIRTELLGFYSPVHGAGQSISAILMGMILAEKAPTLLLNLERFSGLKDLLPRGEETLSELLYYAKVRGDFGAHLKEATEYFGPLAFIPPAREAEDLLESRPEDWRYLLAALRDTGLYRYILVDIGDGVSRERPLLELCTRVYVPIREDEIALKKLTEWQESLAEQGAEELLLRLRTYRLPPPAPEKLTEYRELRHEVWGQTLRALAEAEL